MRFPEITAALACLDARRPARVHRVRAGRVENAVFSAVETMYTALMARQANWLIPPEKFIAKFRELRTRYGVFAVPGNHESYGGGGSGFFERAGIRLLQDEIVNVGGALLREAVVEAAGRSPAEYAAAHIPLGDAGDAVAQLLAHLARDAGGREAGGEALQERRDRQAQLAALALGDAGDHLAADGAQLTLQAAHAGLLGHGHQLLEEVLQARPELVGGDGAEQVLGVFLILGQPLLADKFQPMVASSPGLRGQVIEPKRGQLGGSTGRMVVFPGGFGGGPVSHSASVARFSTSRFS